MNLTEAFARNNIFIERDSEPMYGYGEVYNCCPIRVPTVTFELVATNGLVELADRIRKELGFRPMFPMDEYTAETCDNEGWYAFFIGINGYADSCLDNAIEFQVLNSDEPDNEETYFIDLDEDQQVCIFDWLDEQCRKHLGKSCEELLAEAEAEMPEDDELDDEEDDEDLDDDELFEDDLDEDEEQLTAEEDAT